MLAHAVISADLGVVPFVVVGKCGVDTSQQDGTAVVGAAHREPGIQQPGARRKGRREEGIHSPVVREVSEFSAQSEVDWIIASVFVMYFNSEMSFDLSSALAWNKSESDR